MDEETLRRLAIWRFEQGDPPHEISRRLGRSRRWFLKWLARDRAEGSAALAGRSRAHRAHPANTPEPMRAKVRALRERHPSWGERTIAQELRTAPSRATIGRIRAEQRTRAGRVRLLRTALDQRLRARGRLPHHGRLQPLGVSGRRGHA